MQTDLPSPHALDRRTFMKTAGGLAVLASLPGGLSAAGSGDDKPVVLAFVGCAHIHTPGFIKLLNANRPVVRVKSVWDHALISVFLSSSAPLRLCVR